MKGLSKVAAAVAFATLISTSAVHAQGAEFSLGGGVGIPTGAFDDTNKTGWMGLAAVSFVPNGSPVGIQFDGQYQQYKFDGSTSSKERFLIGTGNVVFKFKTAEDSPIPSLSDWWRRGVQLQGDRSYHSGWSDLNHRIHHQIRSERGRGLRFQDRWDWSLR